MDKVAGVAGFLDSSADEYDHDTSSLDLQRKLPEMSFAKRL